MWNVDVETLGEALGVPNLASDSNEEYFRKVVLAIAAIGKQVDPISGEAQIELEGRTLTITASQAVIDALKAKVLN